jgi:hypothetical protein
MYVIETLNSTISSNKIRLCRNLHDVTTWPKYRNVSLPFLYQDLYNSRRTYIFLSFSDSKMNCSFERPSSTFKSLGNLCSVSSLAKGIQAGAEGAGTGNGGAGLGCSIFSISVVFRVVRRGWCQSPRPVCS